MVDDDHEATDGEEEPEAEPESDTEKSFRERVEEIRERRAAEGEGEEGDRAARMEEMMGGGMGGNPFAQMMGGMMGGGMGGPGGVGGPGGMGGPDRGGTADNEQVVRELRQLRDEVRDVNRTLERMADALEDR